MVQKIPEILYCTGEIAPQRGLPSAQNSLGRSAKGPARFGVERHSKLASDVDSDVKPIMVPLGVMTSAPRAGGFHPVDVVANLWAVFAVASCVTIDSGAVGFQALVASGSPIPVGRRWAAGGE